MLILAPALKNPNQPTMENAAVWIQNGKIHWVGPQADLPPEAQNDPKRIFLENTLLLPGLVNAHAHLELTGLTGIPFPGSFSNWIRAILKAREQGAEGAGPLSEGIRRTLRGGATTLADHQSVTSDLPVLLNSPLRGVIFLEVLGVVPEVAWDILNAALLLEIKFRDYSPRWKVIPSPHSVHALYPDVLKSLLVHPFTLFSIHLAESAEEEEYFRNRTGPLMELIGERGSALKREGKSALRELAGAGGLDSRLLTIHGNYLDEEELDLLKKGGGSIVHCPLSHRYFSHQPFPLKSVLDHGINVALGTDSLASAASLSMFDVLRAAERMFPDRSRDTLFAMATLGGAKALRMDGEVGRIAPGTWADLVGVPFAGGMGALDAIFRAEEASFSMIGGKKVW